MKTEERAALVKYRMQRAEETLSEVSILIDNELANTAVSRLYYACFYAVSALLIKNGIASKTHSGTRKMFILHFIKTEIIEKELGKFYSDIFNERQTSDYSDFIDFDLKEVQDFIKPASQLVAAIKKLLV
ncbi:HEPN domain-containing protein [Pricia sp.]|uniref:HEPN domain-containing protein n=1 Tax=Pricia sp. TaxID=2268138 RepID=UPI0035935094